MANTNTIITEDDVIKMGGIFHQHIVTDTYEGDEYKVPGPGIYLVNKKEITSNT
jgi:hypothetical protein